MKARYALRFLARTESDMFALHLFPSVDALYQVRSKQREN